jgi:glycosyltransferase involved in cell wall biosynthesis
LTGGEEGHVGGVERQTSLLARWLAGRGHRVGLVTWREGEAADETIHGVRVLKVCRREDGWPGLRFVHPRWTSLCAALARADARTYYHNCGEQVTGQVAWWARRHRRRFVFSTASDMDTDPALPDLPSWRERRLYRYGLRRASRVVAQTETQVRRLRQSFGVEAEAVPMPCPGPSVAEFEPPAWRSEAPVLWVGRISRVKRLDRLLDVAAACPEIAFDVVGPSEDGPLAAGLLERARALPNIAVHGGVTRARMGDLYRRAGALLCTSDREGFPNTFIEAWSHGLPLVTTHDPDGLVARLGLGVAVPRDPASIASALRGLVRSPASWTEASVRARRHYLENHTVDRVMERFERILVPREEGA